LFGEGAKRKGGGSRLSGNEKRSTESQTGTPHANRGVVRKMKIKRIKKYDVNFKNAVESVQIRF